MTSKTLTRIDSGRFGRPEMVVLLAMLLLMIGLRGFAAEHPEHNAELAVRTGVEFQPRLGEYHYHIKWARQRVAKGIITVRKDDEHYILTADKRTTKFIDRIYRVRYRGETRISAAALTPSKSVIEEEIKKRKKVQEATYDSASGTVSVAETRTKGDPARTETKTYDIASDEGILDAFTAIFLARSFDWSIGERHSFLVFIGQKQHAVTMDCIGRSSFAIEGRTIPVWVILPRIRETTEAEPSAVSQKTRVFIAADDSRDIVKIETEPGIGTVTLELVRYRQQ